MSNNRYSTVSKVTRVTEASLAGEVAGVWALGTVWAAAAPLGMPSGKDGRHPWALGPCSLRVTRAATTAVSPTTAARSLTVARGSIQAITPRIAGGGKRGTVVIRGKTHTRHTSRVRHAWDA